MSEAPLDERLRDEASLLLQRERELIDLRRARQRTERWLHAFHELSQKLHSEGAAEVIATWAGLLVGRLSFEVAGALEIEESTGKTRISYFDPPAREPVHLNARELELLDRRPSGTCDTHCEPSIRALGSTLGLETFFWLWVKTEPLTTTLVFAGHSARTAPVHTHEPREEGHFLLLARHLATLLSNQRRLAALRIAQDELEAEMRERARVEQALQRAHKLEALGRMAAGIAHEVNNPLTTVVGNLQLCASELERSGSDELRSTLSDAIDATDRIVRIMHDVSTFASPRIESTGSIDVVAAIDTAARIVHNRIRHVAGYEQHVEAVPLVIGERRGLEQVFVHLLTNASQAMPSGRPTEANHIALSARRDGNDVLVQVRDNGVGIPRENLDRVQDPFFTTRAVGEGMGLGLSVCRGILQRFGGELALESTPHEGTAASVRLRVAPLREPLVSTLRAPRVLVIDDEVALLRILDRALRRHGIEVETCSSGKDGLQRYREGSFDVVLCDVMMPGTSGMAVHAALVDMGPEHAERLVFMSGGVFTDEANTYLEQTGAPLLRKPCPTDELLQTIRERMR